MNAVTGRTTSTIASAVVAAALFCGALLIAPMASAETVTPEDFTAQIRAAMDASGVFARGTTLVTQERTLEQNRDGHVMTFARVNADGSLTYRRTTSDSVLDVRCVRRNVCWQRTAGSRGDGTWHLLPKGAVDYTPGAIDLWRPFVAAMPPSAVFDVSRDGLGRQVFSIAVPSGAAAGTTTWTVAEGTTTIVVTSTNADGVSTQTARVVYRALAQRVKVTSPAADAIGRPAFGTTGPVISVTYNGT